MNKFSFLIFIFLVIFNQCKSQSVTFDKIEYASFDVNSYRTSVKDSVFIGLYCSITSDGLINIYNPNDLQDSPKVYYSFKLTNSELKKMKSIFNPNKPLKKYLEKTKLEENSIYAGSYDFYRVSYSNKTTDSICLIVPFVSNSFRDIDDLLSDIFYSRKGRTKISQFNIPNKFFLSLKQSYLGSSYLPEIKNLPPFILEKQN